MTNADQLCAAMAIACEAHRTQKRKGTDIPYIAHPMAVAALVLEFGGSDTQAAAALLHDAIEDGGEAFAARIERALGAEVLTMVRDCTDGTAESKAVATTIEEKRANWRARKQAYLQHLREVPASTPSLLVSACDKLHNARAILGDLRSIGPAVFDRFTANRDATLWYYQSLVDIFVDKRIAPAESLARTVAAMKREAQAPVP